MSSFLALLAKRLRLNGREWLTRAACAPWWTQRGWFVPQVMLPSRAFNRGREATPLEDAMAKKRTDAVYRIVDVVGVSETSWEDAGRNAVETAAGSLRDLRVAEVTKMDMKVENGKVAGFRTRVALSFKYEA